MMARKRSLIITKLTEIVMESESDSSDEDDMVPILKKIKYESQKIERFAEETVPRMSTKEFQSHFRLLPETVEVVQNMILQDPTFANSANSLIVDLHKQLLMTLWIIATPDSFRSVALKFGVSKSTLWFCFQRTICAIARLSSKIIKWPSRNEMQASTVVFEQQAGFPGVIGCIDGCHIIIGKPLMDPEVYINRKGHFSINLQGVVNEKMEFINCYVGEVGSVHDATVFRNSQIGVNMPNRIPDEYHLLGDKAYPLSVNLMTPFKDNGHLTRDQITYNNKLAKTRNIIERCYGLLKGRFRRLKNLEMKNTRFIPTIIMAACVLHNIARRNGDDLAANVDDDGGDDDDDDYIPDSVNTRNRAAQNAAAIAKRQMIVQNVS